MNRATPSFRAMGPSFQFPALPCANAFGIRWKVCGYSLGLLCISLALTACAGGGGSVAAPTAAPIVTVEVAPQSATVPTSGSAQFAATVQNASSAAIQWEVN